MHPYALHTRDTAHWRALVTAAEASAESLLDDELESYLVMLLLRYAAQERTANVRNSRTLAPVREPANAEQLRDTGDRCLIIAGLMPDQAREFGMSIRQVVETGRNGYQEAAQVTGNPVFRRLSEQFVVLMDVLQVMRTLDDDELVVDMFRLYEQWQHTGSQYAFRLLRAATDALPASSCSQQRH